MVKEVLFNLADVALEQDKKIYNAHEPEFSIGQKLGKFEMIYNQ